MSKQMKRYRCEMVGSYCQMVESESGKWVQMEDAEARVKEELEAAGKLVLKAGLSTGHAENFGDLMEEVLLQYTEVIETNHSVDVCSLHWSDITSGDECVICTLHSVESENAALKATIARVGALSVPEVWREIYQDNK